MALVTAGPVVTIGEPLVAFVSTDGPLTTACTYRAYVTGAEVNVAIGLRRLGHGVTFIGRIGADGLSRKVRHVLAAEGVGLERLTTVPDGRTGAIVREPVMAAAPAQVDYHRTASAGSTLGESDVVAATADIRGASWLHVTGVTPALSPSAADAVSHALRLATDAGVPASLDVNMRRKLWTTERAREVLSPLCRHVDVVFADSDELTVLTGLPAVAAVDDLHRRGVRLVVVKQSAEGAIVHEAAHEPLHLAGVRGFPVVDAIGAGDAFVAGFISALLTHAVAGQRGRGRPQYELACLTGAYAVSGHGDTTAFPERWRTTGGEGAVR